MRRWLLVPVELVGSSLASRVGSEDTTNTDLYGAQQLMKYCRHESSNPYDQYAIAAMKGLPGSIAESVVGHLPREISRFTYFLLVCGGVVSCKVTDITFRRSPLVQGGLEIPVEVTVEIEVTENNILAVKKYEALIQEHYKEPVEGKFEDVTPTILEALHDTDYDDTDTDSGGEAATVDPQI